MQSSRLLLFGPPALQQDGLLRPIKPSKPNALACYLCADQGQLVSRTRLLSLFWEEWPEREGRRALTTTLVRIQQAWPGLRIQTYGDTVGCEPEPSLEVDLHLARQWQSGEAVPAGAPAVTPWLNAAAAQAVPAAGRGLSAAAALYRGEFMAEFHLPGCLGFETWLTEQRRFWESRWIESLARLTSLEEGAGAWAALAGHARQAIAIHPHDERFHRRLMQALAMQGDRAGALAQYEYLQADLVRELGVVPEAETELLRDAIALGDLAGRDRTSPAMTRPEPDRVITRTEPQMPPMVGRGHEAALLRGTLFAEQQQPPMALVQGELGIGKSRLVAEVLSPVPEGVTVLTGYCYEDHSRLPYAPIIQALRAALPLFGDGRLRLEEVWLAEVARLLPELSSGTTGTASDPLRLCEGVTRFVAALPVRIILLIEDLHWADEASLLLLAYLLRSGLPEHLHVVATMRSGEAPPALESLVAQLEREGRLQRIHLSALTLPQVEELSSVMAGRDGADLASRVFAETNGHPLFTVELIRTALEGHGGTSHAPALPLPASVEAIMKARLARLPAAARDLAETLAIFPQGAALGDLAKLTGQSAHAVAGFVESALQHGMLHELTETGHGDGLRAPEVRFSHDIVRRTVLSGVSKLRQRLLHGATVELILERLPQGEKTPLPYGAAERLSFHAAAAHRWEQAVRWSLAAADSAERVFAYTAATRLLDQALTAMSNLPPSPERSRRELEIQLRIWRIGHFFNAGGLPEWVESATDEPLSQLAAGEQSEIWLARSEALAIRGYLIKAARLIDFLVPVARLARSPYLLARVLTVAGVVGSLRGQYRNSLRLLNEAVPLYGGVLDDTLAASVQITLPSVHATVGEVEQAVVQSAEFCRRARASGNPALLTIALSTQALIGCMRGAWVEAAQAGWEGIQTARKAGHRYYEYVSTVYHGYAVGRLGDVEHGLRLLNQSVQMAMRLKTQLPLGRNFAWIGELCLLAGDVDQAERAVTRSMRLSKASGYTVGIPLAKKVLAQIRLAQGRTAESVLLAEEALSTFLGMEAMTEVARTHAVLAQAQSGEKGRAHLETALALFDQYGMSAEREELENRLNLRQKQ